MRNRTNSKQLHASLISLVMQFFPSVSVLCSLASTSTSRAAMVKQQQQQKLGGGSAGALTTPPPILRSSSTNNKARDSCAASSSSSMSAASSRSSSSSSSAWAWQWPSCGLGQPTTLSFREQQKPQLGYSTMNAAYFFPDSMDHSCFSNSLSLASVDSFSTASAAAADAMEAEAEAVVRALRSDRLLFQPHASCTLVKQKKQKQVRSFGGATAMSVESRNPYRDFRESMEAMVVSHRSKGVKQEWRWLEEMLGWYLRANGKSTHGLIVGAFVDLLVDLSASQSHAPAAASTSSSSSSTASSPSL